MAKHQGHFEGRHGDSLEDVHRYQERVARYLLPWSEGMDVLDVGASDGYLAGELRSRSYCGIDINPRSDTVLKSTIQEMTMVGRHADLVVYCHVLEHVENPLGELRAAASKMRDDGRLFIAVPHASAPWAYEYPSHLWMFNEQTLTRIAAMAGLVVDEMFRVTFRRDCEELWCLLR